ncbi:MAG: hypothetical protein GTN84_17730 [Hydrogenophaga sp.]|uniref:DM13 domain-containing protein n=1 Tax=Hydrogenophaga sp. TaxID=1904254 RepID=UPI0016B95972|nr:DM13 domain-containing protein [Hydrogenophaga sp.]NIM43084.1 hypothetical protein [Hydrogenophaga sp.]NIN28152.1 hypothetical protein [Hydrogenophaga sp.]NIN30590.1 hypothetical protein [Hydrogenophaga sp.]NIN57287.1 hypothetical protein [Hydrogenophaga sp.]NIO51506.1 hypothetical protein [Hydrogenophaga sp.]
MKRFLWLTLSHGLVLALGFAAGIYTLPLLVAPAAPDAQQVGQASEGALFTGLFRRDLKDSDPLHWGEGEVSVGATRITLRGRLAPGPDYRLYLSPEFVETEADFARLKPRMQQVGPVKTFENFIVELAPGVEPARYNTVIVWCETFQQFITAARYR